MIPSFYMLRTPEIIFGAGKFNELGTVLEEFGNTVLIVTGSSSLKASGKWEILQNLLKDRSLDTYHVVVEDEPSPELVDEAVTAFNRREIDVVLAVGGGSVLDAGKAISAMLLQDKSVVDFLEGIGKGEIHDGKKVPFVAVPTTAGTGTEATANTVLSRMGSNGFKKSLRHNRLIPNVAVIDPDLYASCHSFIIAASGMDALTQLIESYVSTQSTPITDILAWNGMEYVQGNLIQTFNKDSRTLENFTGMAYAALLSGITLTNVGLGIVHGISSPLGAFFPIPHGVVCGTLISAATRMNINKLKESDHRDTALIKYGRMGQLLSGEKNSDIDQACDLLSNILDEWVTTMNIPLLGDYGIKESDLEKIIDKTGQKNNPVELSRQDIKQILMQRL